MRRSIEFAKSFVYGNVGHIILGKLQAEALHGYQIIADIRKEYNVYLGPSTVYPALSWLEEQGLIRFHWDLASKRPRKVYVLTTKGKTMVRHQRMAIQQILRKMEKSGAA